MKKLLFLVSMVIVTVLASCSSESSKRAARVQIIETGQKVSMFADPYTKGDTIQVIYGHYTQKWKMSRYFVRFNGTSKVFAETVVYKAIVL
jgi:hypothetical protein